MKKNAEIFNNIKNEKVQKITLEKNVGQLCAFLEGLKKAKGEFEKWGYSNRAKIFVGDACEIIPLMQGEYDFIFVDGPKTRYIEFLPYLKKMLVNGGILFCDNVLFNGMVAGEQEVGKKKNSIVEKLDLFLKTLFADGDFSSSILPVGDGVSLSIKKKL